MLVDANLLIYAHNRDAVPHDAARTWLTEALNGPTRVGLPWQSLTAFLRITTNPRAFPQPLTASAAWRQVTAWLAAPRAWIPTATDQHAGVLGALIERHQVTGPLVADAELAALAIEHGVTLFSTDADFARFPEVDWQDPIGDPAT